MMYFGYNAFINLPRSIVFYIFIYYLSAIYLDLF